MILSDLACRIGIAESVIHRGSRVGVSSVALLGCLKEPGFSADYRAAPRSALSQSVSRRQQASGAAVSTLLNNDRREYAGLSQGTRSGQRAGSRGQVHRD